MQRLGCRDLVELNTNRKTSWRQNQHRVLTNLNRWILSDIFLKVNCKILKLSLMQTTWPICIYFLGPRKPLQSSHSRSRKWERDWERKWRRRKWGEREGEDREEEASAKDMDQQVCQHGARSGLSWCLNVALNNICSNDISSSKIWV